MEDTMSNHKLDPMSLLLSRNPDFNGLYVFERGPRYGEYARLRESKLRFKRDFDKILREEEERFFGGGDQPRKKPTTKQIRVSPEKINKSRFGFTFNPNPKKSSSSLAQSVPDFSAMIRKENRRPSNSNLLPRRTELTSPPTKSKNAAVFTGSASSTRSASVGEKKSRAMMGISRNSYANVEDLKKISLAASSAINKVGGGRKSIGGGRTILGYRQIY